jgi:hypothetical protein
MIAGVGEVQQHHVALHNTKGVTCDAVAASFGHVSLHPVKIKMSLVTPPPQIEPKEGTGHHN